MAKFVRDLIAHKGDAVFSVAPSDTVRAAIEQMAERGVGALLVMEGEKLSGIVSERDYARQVILKGRASRDTEVSVIMTSEVICVEPETTIEECMTLMTKNRIRHLPVVQDERVIGVISIGDVVIAVIAERDFQIEQLEGYISG
ncbi:histidine kinase [bacterium]|nr:MAG: histidine kinase [bacterium]